MGGVFPRILGDLFSRSDQAFLGDNGKKPHRSRSNWEEGKTWSQRHPPSEIVLGGDSDQIIPTLP